MGVKGKGEAKTKPKSKPVKQLPPKQPDDVEKVQSYADWLIQDHMLNMTGDYVNLEDKTVVSAMPLLRIVRGGVLAFMVIKDFEVVRAYGEIKSKAERIWSSKNVTRLDEAEFLPVLIYKSDTAKDFRGSCTKCGSVQPVEDNKETTCKWRGCGGQVVEADNG